MKRKKPKIIVISILSLIIFSSLFVFLLTKNTTSSPQIISSQYNHVIDIKNKSELSGFVDYIFIGKIEEKTGSIAESEFRIETITGYEHIEIPATKYSVSVLENIKGELRTDGAIEIFKSGGLTDDGKYLFLEDGDFILKTGDICIFFATVREDGTLYIQGKEFNLKLDEVAYNQTYTKNNISKMEDLLEEIKKSEIYQEIRKSYENEIVFERERFTISEEYTQIY